MYRNRIYSMTPNIKVWKNVTLNLERIIMRPIQLLKTEFLIVFHCIYDVIRLHQVSGSSNYDDIMTKQVPGVSGADFVGRHLPSVPNVKQIVPLWMSFHITSKKIRIRNQNHKISIIDWSPYLSKTHCCDTGCTKILWIFLIVSCHCYILNVIWIFVRMCQTSKQEVYFLKKDKKFKSETL